MPIDTKDKRSSAIHTFLPWRGLLPSPGIRDQPDRQHVALLYRGIQAGGFAPPVVSDLKRDGMMLHMSRWMA